MTRRSTRLSRLENSLYSYNKREEVWDILETNTIRTEETLKNLFDLGSYFTCKHMSQKVNPTSFRIGINKTWDSCWYSSYKNSDLGLSKLHQDLLIRKYLMSTLNAKGILIGKLQVKERDNTFFVRLNIYEAGSSYKRDSLLDFKRKKRFNSYLANNVDRNTMDPFFIRKEDSSKKSFVNMPLMLTHLENSIKIILEKPVYISVKYVNDLGDNAAILCNYLVRELEKPNMNFKRVLKDSLGKIVSKENIRGLRVNCSGRLGRAPMAKMEWFKYGSIPLTKISANIDYKYLTGKTKYGSFGIKVWLYKY